MITTVIKIRRKRFNASNHSVSLVAKTNSIIVHTMHVLCQISLDRVEYKFNRSINEIVWCVKGQGMAGHRNQIGHVMIVMGAGIELLASD